MALLSRGIAWLGVKGSVLLAVVVILGGALVAEKLQHGHTRNALSNMTASYQNEVAAHELTVSNYRAAAEEARRKDAENKLRVESERRAETERITRDYQARLADARARFERLRDQLKAGGHPGTPGAAPMPGLPGAPGGADGAPEEDGFPLLDRLIATEQAIQLDGLQQWIKRMSEVKTEPVSPSTSASVNR